MFLRLKGDDEKYDNLHVLIELKGEHLLKADKWKENFMLQISQIKDTQWLTNTSRYKVWGVPFYNEEHEALFNDNFAKTFL